MKYLNPVNVLAVSILLAGMSAAQITDPSNAQANTDSSVQAANKLSRFDLGKLDITGLKFLGMKVTQVNRNQPGSQVNNPDSPNTGSTTNVMLGPVQFSSAPALSAVIIAAVCSADLGTPPPGEILCETISSGQVATTDPQGGSFEYVVEEELGYGDNPVATMNGSVLPSSLLIETQNICEDFSGNLTFSCQAGETVVGFAHWYNTTSFQSGRFTYQLHKFTLQYPKYFHRDQLIASKRLRFSQILVIRASPRKVIRQSCMEALAFADLFKEFMQRGS